MLEVKLVLEPFPRNLVTVSLVPCVLIVRWGCWGGSLFCIFIWDGVVGSFEHTRRVTVSCAYTRHTRECRSDDAVSRLSR